MTAPKSKSATPTTPTSLDERIALATAPAWVPVVPGERLENVTVVGLQIFHDEEYGDTPVVVYRKQDGGYVKLYAFAQVLREQLAELKTDMGSVQNIVFIGKQDSKKRTRKDADGKDVPIQYTLTYAENVGAEMKVVAEDFKF
jgi:hypothetical protein